MAAAPGESEYEEEYEYEDEEEPVKEAAATPAAAAAPPKAAEPEPPAAPTPSPKPGEEKLSWKERKDLEKKKADEAAAAAAPPAAAEAAVLDENEAPPTPRASKKKPAAAAPVPEPASPTAARAAAPAGARDSPGPGEAGRMYGSKTADRKQANYAGGKPSKFDKAKLMKSEGIVPIQAGSNKFASQRGMTGMGMPRDVVREARVRAENLAELTDEAKIASLKGSIWLQSGTNKFASQKGMTGIGTPRDVCRESKVQSQNLQEVPEEKARLSDGIVPLQSGTNKLASQAGMTGMGMPRIVDVRKTNDQDRESQGFIHLQMGTNRFANQSGMTGFGMPRREITKYKDEVRGEMPHDEGSLSRQTSGWKEGASQAGSTGFGAFRNNTLVQLQNQDQRSQGLIPYQMGVNFLDSQAGKTGFGMPRRTYTPYVDDNHEDLAMNAALQPEVPFWSGSHEAEFANQTGMTAFGTPRDVRGGFVNRMW